ncbi:MAG: hypothetical protein KAI24_06845 [Planctomycetes bacterium]|nr:hypothetical protein [Planctomycetota bacterium]
MTATPDDIIEQLAAHAPPGTTIPQLLRDFVSWSRDVDELGSFRFVGGRLDDFCVEDGSRAASCFFSFLCCTDGSMVGWWRPAGEALAEAPIVVLGSEGELVALGMDLAEFLSSWSRDALPLDDLSLDVEDEDHANAVAARQGLRRWLVGLGLYSDSPHALLPERTAALRNWFAVWSAERRRIAAADERRVALAAQLRDRIGLPSEPWRRRFVDAIVTAKQCQLFRTFVGQQPVDVSPALESELRRFREHDAMELPEAGLWFRAALGLNIDGTLEVKRSYLDAPNCDEVRLDVDGVRQDLLKMPRSSYWMPPWLQA